MNTPAPRRFVAARCTLALSLCALVGCGKSYMILRDTKPALGARPEAATLAIVRTTSTGFGVTMDNYLDGKMIGQTRGRCYFLTDVPAGTHYVVGTAENTAVARLSLESGRVYALRQALYPGVMKARTGYEPLTAAEARQEMADGSCDYREYDRAKPGPDMDAADYKEAVDDFEKEVREDPSRHKDTLEYKGFESL